MENVIILQPLLSGFSSLTQAVARVSGSTNGTAVDINRIVSINLPAEIALAYIDKKE